MPTGYGVFNLIKYLSIPPRFAAVSVFVVLFMAARPVQAEVVVSNFTETSGGTLSISTTQSVAGAFTTGSSAFVLDKITLNLGSASGASSVFTVSLFSSNLGLPGTLIQTLSGPASPQPAGQYDFTSSGSTLLSAGTTYFWVGTLASSTSTDRRRAVVTSSFNETSSFGWTIANTYYVKGSSGVWNAGGNNPFQFSVTATSAVPEPGAYAAFAGLAAIGFIASRRRPRANR